MASEELIKHKGRVTRVADGAVWVDIDCESACSACHARNLCSITDKKTKSIQAVPPEGVALAPGDAVMVVLRAALGLKAVLFIYVIPLLLLIAALFTSALPIAEYFVAIIALGVLALYYFIIYLFRHSFEKKYVFTIEPIRTN